MVSRLYFYSVNKLYTKNENNEETTVYRYCIDNDQ